MMKLLFLALITIAFYPGLNFAQSPNLGVAESFALFTTNGAVGNTSPTYVKGDIGTNLGGITGFDAPSVVIGSMHIANFTTSQAASDLLAAYNQLFNTTPTVTDHSASFGNNEILVPGVYSINQAASVVGTLTLNAQGIPSSLFIFKINGALTTAAGTTIKMINETASGNIFWIAEGAISMGANTSVKGTFIAHSGAISMGTTGNVEGRLFSTGGAVSVYADSVALPQSYNTTVPVKLTSFTAACNQQTIKVNWSTASEINNKHFLLENSANLNNWKTIATISGAGTSSLVSNYNFSYPVANKEANYFRLTQFDFDGNYKQSAIINVQACASKGREDLIIFPNPSAGKINLLFDGDKSKIKLTTVFNALGKKIFENYGYQSTIDLSTALPGVYYIKLQTSTTAFNKEVIIKRD